MKSTFNEGEATVLVQKLIESGVIKFKEPVRNGEAESGKAAAEYLKALLKGLQEE